MGFQKDEYSLMNYLRRISFSAPRADGSASLDESSEQAGLEESKDVAPFFVQRDTAFDVADELEKGLVDEAVASKEALTPVHTKEAFRRCCIFHSADPADEFHMMSETGDSMISARFVRRERRIDFFLPDVSSQAESSTPPWRRRPTFSMSHSENGHEWILVQDRCDHCAQRPKHLTCEFLGKGQQVAFIRHSRRPVGKAHVHYVDVHVPAIGSGTQSTVWCPVTTGRDLGRQRSFDDSIRARHSAPQLNATWESGSPKGRCKSCPSSPSASKLLQTSEEEEPVHITTKLPEWNEEFEMLIQEFEARKVESSPMNFALCIEPGSEEHSENKSANVVLQHAKMGKNSFFLDFKHPLNSVQAFAVAMSSLLWQ